MFENKYIKIGAKFAPEKKVNGIKASCTFQIYELNEDCK